MINKIKSNLLHIKNLSKYMPYMAFDKAAKSRFKLEILSAPAKGSVLVLAPHPDDDIFGCGGTLKLHADQGDKIQIIYFSASKDRQIEAQNAAAILGINDLIFRENKDGSIFANDSDTNFLVDTINKFGPENIYTPYFLDPNSDHVEVAKMLQKALTKINYNGKISFYEIWSLLYANRLVTIDKSLEGKKSAIKAHASQLKSRNYEEAILGLNKYRAGMFNAGTYAEAFLEMNSDLLLELVKIYDSLKDS